MRIDLTYQDANYYYKEMFSEKEWNKLIFNIKLKANTPPYEKELTDIYKQLMKNYYRLYLLSEKGSFEYYRLSDILNQLWHEYIHQKSSSENFCQMDFENQVEKHPFVI